MDSEVLYPNKNALIIKKNDNLWLFFYTIILDILFGYNMVVYLTWFSFWIPAVVF